MVLRLLIPCMKCFQEFGKPSEEYSQTEFRDDGLYQLVCSYGHVTTTVLQEQKFEILFEIGVNALLDGYYREAISSFTSCLERFYEFALQVLLEEADESGNLYSDCWSKVKAQSERQLGAFVFLWASKFNETPDVLSEKYAKFRNQVIHKGRIPTREEAINYGNSILSCLIPKIEKLKENFPNDVQKIISRHLLEKCSLSGKGQHISTMSIPTFVSLIRSDMPTSSNLEHHMEWLLQDRKRKNLAKLVNRV